MGHYIVCLRDGDQTWWLEWSTVVDAPVMFGMSENAFRDYYIAKYGSIDAERFERARSKGTSARYASLQSLIMGNHAGPDGSRLTHEELLTQYCRDPETQADIHEDPPVPSTMDALQDEVEHSHTRHFKATSRKERLRDLQNEVSEIVHHRDEANLREEIGDAGWSLLQLCNEIDESFGDLVMATVRKLDLRAAGQKVALIGTSANPITNAHLTMALEVLALTDVDEVWFLVVGQHPWGKKLMPAEHRLEMARLATAQYPKIRVCDFEVVHGPRIYESDRETADILRNHLLPAFPTYRFRWVMGSDVAQTFHQWKGHEWMAANIPAIVIHRLGFDFDKSTSPLSGPEHVYLKDNVVTSNISSTLVRERGRSYDPTKLVALVPEVVWNHLVAHRLLDEDALS